VVDLGEEIAARRLLLTRIPRGVRNPLLQDFLNSTITAELRARAFCSCGRAEQDFFEAGDACYSMPKPPEQDAVLSSAALSSLQGFSAPPTPSSQNSVDLSLAPDLRQSPAPPESQYPKQDPFQLISSSLPPVLRTQQTAGSMVCDLCCKHLRDYLLCNVPEMVFQHCLMRLVPCPPPRVVWPHLPQSLPCDLRVSLARVQELAAKKPSFLSGAALLDTPCQTLHKVIHMTQFDQQYTLLLDQKCFWLLRVVGLPSEFAEDVPVPECLRPFLLTGILDYSAVLPYADYVYRMYSLICSKVRAALPPEATRLVHVCFEYDLRTSLWFGSATLACTSPGDLPNGEAESFLAPLTTLFKRFYLEHVVDYRRYSLSDLSGGFLDPAVQSIIDDRSPYEVRLSTSLSSLRAPPASAPPNHVIAVLNALTDRELASPRLMEVIIASFWDLIDDDFYRAAVQRAYYVNPARYSVNNEPSIHTGYQDQKSSCVVRFCGMDLITPAFPGEGMLFFELRPDIEERDLKRALAKLNRMIFLGRALYAVRITPDELEMLVGSLPVEDESGFHKRDDSALTKIGPQPSYWEVAETWEDWLRAETDSQAATEPEQGAPRRAPV